MTVLLSDSHRTKAKGILQASSLYLSVCKYLIILKLLSMWLELSSGFRVLLLRFHPQQGCPTDQSPPLLATMIIPYLGPKKESRRC